MVVGLLLLYIGIRFHFPFMYFVGCWFVICVGFLKGFVAFMKGVEDGKQRTD